VRTSVPDDRALRTRKAKSAQRIMNKSMEITCEAKPATMTFFPVVEPALSLAVEANAPPTACKINAIRSEPTKTFV
jgi:hypothetical protein